MAKKIKIIIDPELCIGAASCVTIKPDVFQLNDENKAVVLDPADPDATGVYEREIEVSDEDFENVILGAQSCPTRAIFLYDEEGTQIFPEE
jgi:ferredoxin